jgi:hypothetical protein
MYLCLAKHWRQKALTSSVNIISNWLVWKPGNGRDIRIGVDPMIRSHHFYKLSKNLILLLKEQGVTCLTYAGSIVQEGSILTNWKNAKILGLEGVQKDEWTNYTKGLVNPRR